MKPKRKLLWIIPLVLLLIGGGVAAALYLLRGGWVPPVPMPDLEPVEPPAGAQLLLLPIDDGVVTAGFGNPNYLEKYGYPHYGIDITAAGGGYAEILASGDGTVLGTEFCDNPVGHIAVIRYDDVYIPRTGQTIPLIVRYYHMISLQIETGDTVTAGQIIGDIDRRHEWYHHIHMEVDTDVGYPFHTPQVADSSSALLQRYPADGSTITEPVWTLVVGEGQRIYVHPNAKNCSEKDMPQYTVSTQPAGTA